MPRLSENERNQAIGMLQSGMQEKHVATRFAVHRTTIVRLRDRYQQTGSVKDHPRPGQPRKTSRQDDRSIRLRVLRNRFVSARQLQYDLRRDRNVRLSVQAIRNRIKVAGLKSYRPYKGLILTPAHRIARLRWSRLYQRYTLARWNRVLVTDESRFMLSKVDGRERVWRRPLERLSDACITENDRYGGGGSVMVWGGISGRYRTDLVVVQGNLTGIRYRDEILSRHVHPFMTNHPDVDLFQHDNARPHIARVCQAYLQNAGIHVMEWPAKLPDLSPIENLWATLGDQIKARPVQPTTLVQLGTALQQEWHAIPQATIRNLFNSMRRRCTKCIHAHGGHIAY